MSGKAFLTLILRFCNIEERERHVSHDSKVMVPVVVPRFYIVRDIQILLLICNFIVTTN